MSKVIQNIKKLASLGLQACAERDALQAELTALHAENDHLKSAFMGHLQDENRCPETGVMCRDIDNCGCAMEVAAWLKRVVK